MSKVLNLVININIITAIFSTLPGPFSFSTLRASMPTSPVLCNLFWLICLRLPSAHPHLKQIPPKHTHTHTHTHTHSHTHTHTRTHAHTHTLTHTATQPHTHTHKRPHHTRTHTHTLPPLWSTVVSVCLSLPLFLCPPLSLCL